MDIGEKSRKVGFRTERDAVSYLSLSFSAGGHPSCVGLSPYTALLVSPFNMVLVEYEVFDSPVPTQEHGASSVTHRLSLSGNSQCPKVRP